MLLTWDAGSAQLGVYEWPEAMRYRGTDTIKDAKPVADKECLVEALDMVMLITEHLARTGCGLRKTSLLVDRTDHGMKLLAATCFKVDK